MDMQFTRNARRKKPLRERDALVAEDVELSNLDIGRCEPGELI